jgi:hypothetical protein
MSMPGPKTASHKSHFVETPGHGFDREPGWIEPTLSRTSRQGGKAKMARSHVVRQHHRPVPFRPNASPTVASFAIVTSYLSCPAKRNLPQLGRPVFVSAVIGNAAEHSTAVYIAVGSSIQIALFVAPVSAFASMIRAMLTRSTFTLRQWS